MSDAEIKTELEEVVKQLKSLSRFDLANYRSGEYSIDTEREYNEYGNYIDSDDIYSLIVKLEDKIKLM